MLEETLYEAIVKRKSIRKYDMTPLEANKLDEISSFMKTVTPLYDNIRTSFEIVSPDEIRGILFSVKAPHYIVASSVHKEGYPINVGFMLQEIDLYLSSIGYGACWLGMTKPTKDVQLDRDMEFVVAMAFGKPLEPLYREDPSEFRRKPLEQISNVNGNALLEAARLAPSASNGQPWRFIVADDRIHAFCIRPNPLTALIMKKINMVDMGIAIRHIWLAAKHLGKEPEFITDPEAIKIAPLGYYYSITIKV